MSYIDKNILGIGYAKREIFIDPAYADGWNAAIEILENTPNADVEPIRHGEWIDKGDANYYCSECDGAVRHNYPNCPFCRAKMDKGET